MGGLNGIRTCVRNPPLLCLAATLLLFVSAGCGGTAIGPGEAATVVVASVTPTTHPLVARYTARLSAGAAVYVEFGRDSNYSLRTHTEVVSAGETAEFLIAGMRANTKYRMRLVDETAGGRHFVDTERVFDTGQVPPESVPAVVVTNSAEHSGGVELLNMVVPNGTYQAAVVDLEGQLIWYYEYDGKLGFPYPIRPLDNGNMLITIGTGILREVDLEGKTVRELRAADLNPRLHSAGLDISITGFHHEALPLRNGHIIVLCEVLRTVAGVPTPVRGDVLIDLDANFNPVWAWSAFDHLDVAYHPMDVEDWTHGNSLAYSPTDGALLLSLRNLHWVVKINYQDGKGDGRVDWRLGPGGDFQLAGGVNQDWFYGQHFPVFAEGDTSMSPFRLGLFDNRATNQDGSACATDNGTCYSRAVILRVDQSTKSASIEWEYSPNLYSLWGGNVLALPNGNVELALSNPFPGLGSRVIEVNHAGQVLFQMDITNQLAYRAYRIPSLYPGVQW